MNYYMLNDDHSVRKISFDEMLAGGGFNQVDRTVAKTNVGPYRISTVFLMMDHGWGDGPPVLFETMIFNNTDCDKYSDFQERYSTWDEAVAGHASAVEMVKITS